MEAVIFDLDGTLVDHKAAEIQAATSLHSQNGLETSVSISDFLRRWSHDLEEIYPRYTSGEITFEEQRALRVQATWRSFGINLETQSALKIFKDYLAQYEQNWKAFADVHQCLESLSSLKLGLITNGNRAQQYKKLRQCKLEKFFEVIVVSEEVGIAKPKKEIFHLACQKMRVEPNKALYIGDRWDLDVLGPLEAGLRGIWLNRDQVNCPDPNADVTTLTDLLNIRDRLGLN